MVPTISTRPRNLFFFARLAGFEPTVGISPRWINSPVPSSRSATDAFLNFHQYFKEQKKLCCFLIRQSFLFVIFLIIFFYTFKHSFAGLDFLIQLNIDTLCLLNRNIFLFLLNIPKIKKSLSNFQIIFKLFFKIVLTT